jgi:hypothetical protein
VPEVLFDRKKLADAAWDVHIATDTVSWGDAGRPRRDVGAEKAESELRGRICCARTRARRARRRNMHYITRQSHLDASGRHRHLIFRSIRPFKNVHGELERTIQELRQVRLSAHRP